MKLASFFASSPGRGLRIVLGLSISTAGILAAGPATCAIALGGLVPASAAILNVCLVAPFLHAPIRGREAADS